jgi:signal transduction histidine kinase
MGECVRFSLTDSGNGIPVEIANQLTEAFFTTKEAGSGTGLGLSISKTIIDSHFGQLFVDHDCLNTKFVFDIPKGLNEIT